MLREELQNRQLPELLTFRNGEKVTAENWPRRRAEILDTVQRELVGILPDIAWEQRTTALREDGAFLEGKAVRTELEISIRSGDAEHAWPVTLILPAGGKRAPVFVMACFDPALPLDGIPVEELVAQGFGLCMYACPAVTKDDPDFTDGLASLFYPDGSRGERDGGKIALWAWAASRIVDALAELPGVDTERLMIVGHSRYGKTALWAGAAEERFAGVVSVQSGCGGAALARGNTGEKVADITKLFAYWFTPVYRGYAGREEEMPFDQHFLLSLIAPRLLYVTSAAGDLWADPRGEYLDCVAVSPVYALLGRQPVEEAEQLTDEMTLHGGDIGYSRRPGGHAFLPEDWQRVCAFMKEKLI